VVAVESDAAALADAASNLEGLEQVVLVGERVDRALEQAPEGFEAEVVVLDPPRSGAGRGVVERIAARPSARDRLRRCDPAALAPGPRLLRRARVRAGGSAGLRPVPDDAPRGMRGGARPLGSIEFTAAGCDWRFTGDDATAD